MVKSIIIVFCFLTTLYSTVIAGRPGIYERIPDPEGQYPRLGACPDDHACIFPADVAQFLPGAYFDLRVELHSYDKKARTPAPEPYTQFKTTIRKNNGSWMDVNEFFGFQHPPELQHWHFSWIDSIETRYAKQLGLDKVPVDVNVSSRVWRKIKFDEPGTYDISVQYGPKDAYTVRYTVIQPKTPSKKAKNAILFIADGCNTAMITAARAVSRKHTSGKYESFLSFEDFDNLGHIITHSIDGLVTDSANSASAYSTGHKARPNALGVYTDSSDDPFDDPKVELITELIRRRQPGKGIGIVTTAYGQDATPSSLYAHTSSRFAGDHIADQFVHGVSTNWVNVTAPDVFLAGGAEYLRGPDALNQTDYHPLLKQMNYQIVLDKHELNQYHSDDKLYGVFRKSNLDVWMERNVFINNTVGNKAAPDMSGKDALGTDQPGLEDMTIKALEVLKKRGGKDGFFLMSEAASVDKQLHTLDFPRSWADLLELDATIKKTVEWLKKNGEYEDTLILFTADHGHSFDVYGSVDVEFIQKHANQKKEMLNSIGVYERSGWPGYFDNDGDGFPDNWAPQITLAGGSNNGPDHYESWILSTDGPKLPAVKSQDKTHFVANKQEMAGNYGDGLHWNGNIPLDQGLDVHSMTDVAIYSNGPGSDLFKKTMENWELFFKLTEALDLQHPTTTAPKKDEKQQH
ncbi:alkaline-phosphatase-like protein [Phascolomyces articulosus]|uniref:alkaline phosphatase n=1 Tax=Phascolomyces articulosus TaxID=60185 RepID=A0AAD5KP60_9FUNG|nr:alkaline-phosphatase-like protein [Phascolomyces articulosus]